MVVAGDLELVEPSYIDALSGMNGFGHMQIREWSHDRSRVANC